MRFVKGSKVELKEEVNSELKKDVIAFANTEGGEIFVGVSEDGVIVGVENVEDEIEEICMMIGEEVKPDLLPYVSVEGMEFDEGDVIRVGVSRGAKLPYHLRDAGLNPKGVYLRQGSTLVATSSERIEEMMRESDGSVFERARSVNQDLTFLYAEDFFSERKMLLREKEKRALGLIDDDGYYTNAGLLISDQCEYSVKCAIFSGEGKSRFRTRKEFFGSILKQLERSFEYINLYNDTKRDVEKQGDEGVDYPESAIKEALINAIIHRDYNFSGSTLVNLFTNRMEIISIGGLVEGINLSDILYGVSQPRNMVLANIFYRLRLIESYGTGIGRILESYKGGLLPEFIPGATSFVTVLPNKNVYSNVVSGDMMSRMSRDLGYDVQKRASIGTFVDVPRGAVGDVIQVMEGGLSENNKGNHITSGGVSESVSGGAGHIGSSGVVESVLEVVACGDLDVVPGSVFESASHVESSGVSESVFEGESHAESSGVTEGFVDDLFEDVSDGVSQIVVEDLSQNSVGDLSRNSVGSLPQNTVGDLSRNLAGSLPQNTVGDLSRNLAGSLSQSSVGDLSQNPVGDLPRNSAGNLSQSSVGNLSGNSVGISPRNTRESVAPNGMSRVIALENPSEKQVLKLFASQEVVTRRDVEELLGCSGFPARQILNSLLEKRKIQVYGKGRATKYLLL